MLIIDDDRELAESIGELLSTEHEVCIEYDGLAGLRRLERELVDLVLLDMQMPGADGQAVLRALSARGISVPVLAMSASPAQRAVALRLGAAEFSGKPFDRTWLEDTVARLIAGASPRN